MLRIFIVFVIKANTKDKNPNQILSQLSAVIKALDGNANFPITNPTLAMLQAQKEELEQAILEAESGAHNKIAARNEVIKQTKEMMGTLATFINLKSDGDLSKALSSGFPQRATPTPAGLLPAAGNVRGKALGDGKIKLMWKGVKGKQLYNVSSTMELSAQPVWVERGEPSRNSIIIEGLIPGVMYYFRVAAKNSFGTGIHSDIVAIRCV